MSCEVGRGQQRVVDRRQLGRGAAARIDADQRRRLDEALAQAEQAAVAGRRQRAEGLVGGDLARRAVQRQFVHAHGAGVVDRAEQPAAVARPDQAAGGAVPVGEQLAGLAGTAVVQHHPALVGVETADALLHEAQMSAVGAVQRRAVAGLVAGAEIARVLAAAAVGGDRDREHVVVG
jgi:hypothetical protein